MAATQNNTVKYTHIHTQIHLLKNTNNTCYSTVSENVFHTACFIVCWLMWIDDKPYRHLTPTNLFHFSWCSWGLTITNNRICYVMRCMRYEKKVIRLSSSTAKTIMIQESLVANYWRQIQLSFLVKIRSTALHVT